MPGITLGYEEISKLEGDEGVGPVLPSGSFEVARHGKTEGEGLGEGDPLGISKETGGVKN